MADTVRATSATAYVKAEIDTEQVAATTVAAYVRTILDTQLVRATLAGAYVKVSFIPSGYAVGLGHNLPSSFLGALAPQPRNGGIKVTRRVHSGNRDIQDDALYTELEYDMFNSPEEYQSVLTQLGVLDAMEASITVTLRNQTQVWTRYNATVVQPRIGENVEWQGFFPRNIRILLKDLSEAT